MGDKLNEWIDANSATLQALAGPGQPDIPPSAIPGAAGPPGAPPPGFPPGQPPTAGGFPAPQAAAGPGPIDYSSAFPPEPTPEQMATARGAQPPAFDMPFMQPQGPTAQPVDVQAPAPPEKRPAPKPKAKDAVGFDEVMKDADPKQIDEAIKVMEAASGKSVEELYTQQTGAPPPKGMGKRKLGQALFEFGLNLMAAPAGLSDVETIGRAGQATIAGRRQREEKAEAKQVAADERRALAEERRMGRIDKQFDRAAVLKRLEIEQQRLQHLLNTPIGPFKDYLGVDGYLYSRDAATGEARQVMHKGKPFKPDPKWMKTTERKLEWELKLNGYMAVHGVDSQDKPLTGAALRRVKEDALAYASEGKQMEESEARKAAREEAARLFENDDDFFSATPDEQARMIDERSIRIANFYMLRTDKVMGNKPDPSRLTEGVATPIKDPDTGVMEYWTLDAEGNAKQVTEQQVLQNK